MSIYLYPRSKNSLYRSKLIDKGVYLKYSTQSLFLVVLLLTPCASVAFTFYRSIFQAIYHQIYI